jgi:glycosyltransferase involved in cell wall biosynthesis
MINIKVSVAIVTYNRPEFLKKAIEGVLSQTYENFELLICDNGSCKETKSIVDLFVDSRIKYYRNENNDIQFLNYPFVIANGEYLVITHDDDVMNQNFLEHEVELLDKYDNLSAVFCNVNHINNVGKIIRKNVTQSTTDIVYNKLDYIKSYLYNGNVIYCPTLMMRMDCIREFKIKYFFDIGPMADLYLNFLLNLEDRGIYYSNFTLYNYRIHVNQDSKINGVSMAFQGIPELKRLLEKNGYDILALEFEQSALSQLMCHLILKLLSGRISAKEFINNFLLCYNNGFKLNRYFFHWLVLRPLMRVFRLRVSIFCK